MLFGIIAGASVCFFEATTKALSDRRDRGRRFKALLTHFYPWGDDCLAATDCVHVLYDLARNPLTHSLGLGNGPHVTGIRQVSILKWPISGEQIEELERAHVRPIWTRPTIDRPRLPQARGEVVLSVPTLYWGVHRTLHALFQDERQIASADALVAHLRNEWAQYRLDAPL
jgi:hypothetical protein